MAQRLREMEELVKGTVRREMDLGIKERQMEQLAEDYKLELNDSKAKITNLAFQVQTLKEQNRNLLDEMGNRVRTGWGLHFTEFLVLQKKFEPNIWI